MESSRLAQSTPDEARPGGEDANTVAPVVPCGLTERDLAFLHESISPLFEFTSRQKAFEFIAASLSASIGNTVVLVNSFDEASGALRVRAVGGLGPYMDRIVSILGRQPLAVAVPINNEARAGLSSGKLREVAGGVYELATRSLSQAVCRGIEGVLNIKHFYAMGVTWRGRILGSVVILKQTEIQNPSTIETFVNYSAAAIHRLDRAGGPTTSVTAPLQDVGQQNPQPDGDKDYPADQFSPSTD